MAVRLLVRQRSEAGGAEKGTEVLLDEDTIQLGRDKTCHVVLAQQAVSRTHARISKDGQLFFIEDLGSAYGTRVNRQDLPKGEKRLLRNGDVIAIAQFDVSFERIPDAIRHANSNNTSFVARQAVRDILRPDQDAQPSFRFMNGPREGERVELPDAHELVIGREEDADIVLRDDLVSRRHAKVRRDWSGTHVEDLESRNGVKVNKKRVSRRTLKDRDEVEIGGIRLLYIDPHAVSEQAMSLLSGSDAMPPDDAEVLPNGTSLPEPSALDPIPSEMADMAGEGEGAADEAEAMAADDAGEEAPAEDELPAEEALPEPVSEVPREPSGSSSSSRSRSKKPMDLRSPQALVTLGSLGVVAIAALIVIVALLVGA